MKLRYNILIGLCITTAVIFAQDRDSIIIDNFELVPDKEAKIAVSKIVRYTGLTANFHIVSKDVSTAVAYIQKGKRCIAYNPEFIERLRNATKTDWAAVSVLAHEIGHHLLGHTLKKKWKPRVMKLMADKFSGFILHQMGAKLEEAKAAMNAVGHKFDTISHPPL